MLAARAQGERQDNIAAVMRTGSAGEIIAIAATDPKHFGCEQPGNMWHLADSYVATNDKASALTLYRQAVVTCGPDERLTAIQKARAIVDLKDVIVLIDTPGAAKNPAEADIRAEIAKAVADMSKKPGKADPNGAMMKLLAAAIDRAQPGAPVPEIAAKAAEKADKQKTAKTAEMLGWLYKKSGDNINAIAWFRKAVEWGNSKEARSGLVYVLADSGDAGRKEAMALAKTWADAVPSSMFAEDQTMAGLAEAQKAKDWAKCRELAAGAKNAAASLIGAWCAHEAGESRMALVAFKAVATSGTASAAELDDAKKGWVITAAALKDSTEIGDLRARGLLSKAEDQSLTREIGMASFWDAYTKKKYAVAMNIMAGLSDKNIPLTDKEIVTGGWAAYQSGACGKAWTAFKKLFESKDEEVRKEAQRGFRAVSGAYKSDTANICGKDHSYQGDGVFN
jgi:hypothetical protein